VQRERGPGGEGGGRVGGGVCVGEAEEEVILAQGKLRIENGYLVPPRRCNESAKSIFKIGGHCGHAVALPQ